MVVVRVKWKQEMSGKNIFVVLADRRTAETVLVEDEQMPEATHLEQFTQVPRAEVNQKGVPGAVYHDDQLKTVGPGRIRSRLTVDLHQV